MGALGGSSLQFGFYIGTRDDGTIDSGAFLTTAGQGGHFATMSADAVVTFSVGATVEDFAGTSMDGGISGSFHSGPGFTAAVRNWQTFSFSEPKRV